MKTPGFLIPLGLLVCGCSIGPEIAEFKPAQRPEGVHLEVTLKHDVSEGRTVEGELLEVRADGLLLNVDRYPVDARTVRRIVLIPYPVMKTVRGEQMGRAVLGSGAKPLSDPFWGRLRLVSRFPQGLNEGLLTQLLNDLGQETLAIPKPRE
ncbi:MAG TPA: hypothetical protein VE175_11465 [Woeseiaceae bacterium]|jgi:hypothetical protein|nr:hypothetical protein [Woeseiaceae bacterium]